MEIPLSGGTPQGAGPAQPAPAQPAVPAARELVGQVLSSDPGTLLLRIGRSTVETRSTVDLPTGAAVRLAVVEATPERVVLSLGGAAGANAGANRAPTDELTALLARTLGQALAGPLARLLAGRGADPGEAAALAARFLTGEDSPVRLLRRLAVRDPKLRNRLIAAERATTSGDPAALREAAADLRDAARTPPEVARAQRLLDARPGEGAPSLFFLPLPHGREARVTLEAGARGERVESFRLAVELSLQRLGDLSVEVLGHQGAAFVTIRSARGGTVHRLSAALPALEEAVSTALGLPTRAAVLERPPAGLAVVAEADVYA